MHCHWNVALIESDNFQQWPSQTDYDDDVTLNTSNDLKAWRSQKHVYQASG